MSKVWTMKREQFTVWDLKEFSSKFCENFLKQQTFEEGQKWQQVKSCNYYNQVEDTSPNISVYDKSKEMDILKIGL